MSNIDDTLKERGSRYGEFTGHAEITQGLKDAMVTGVSWHLLEDDMKEALEMVAHKIGRIVNGDPTYIDSWTDIIGYTRLVEKRLIAEQNSARALLRTGDSVDATTFGPVTASNVHPLGTTSPRNRSEKDIATSPIKDSPWPGVDRFTASA